MHGSGISKYKNIRWEIIKGNPGYAWEWEGISMNPNLRWWIVYDKTLSY